MMTFDMNVKIILELQYFSSESDVVEISWLQMLAGIWIYQVNEPQKSAITQL